MNENAINGTRIQTDARPDITESNAPRYTAIAPIRTERHLPAYNMNHAKRGMAVIFNHEFFLNKGKARLGTNADCELLERTLKKKQFEVSVHRDLSSTEILKEVERIAKLDHTDSDCIVIVILTHGGQAEISASDAYYKLDAVTSRFTADRCPSLAGKPKIFVVQACRGGKRDSGILLPKDRCVSYNTFAAADQHHNAEEDWPRASVSLFMRMCTEFFQRCCKKGTVDALKDSANVYSLPLNSDFLIAYSTTMGHVSYRNEKTGGPYIQELCEALDEYGNDMNIYELLDHTNNRVALQSSFENKQMPTFQSSLRGTLKFNDKV